MACIGMAGERRSLVSFVLPFLRWLGGAER